LTVYLKGQTEAQVHRLKLIKRLAYGRASFELLRLRVLHGSGGRIRKSAYEPLDNRILQMEHLFASARFSRGVKRKRSGLDTA
jgi:hypothetical protein